MEVSRKTSLAHRLVNLLESPSTEKTHRELGIGNQDIEYRENRQRKRSILQKIVDIIFYDDENNPGDISSKIQQISVVTQNEVTKEQMFLEMQQLDRDRKKSVFMRVIDGLLFRSEQSQEELSTENIEGHSEVDSANGEYTGDNHWKEEGLHVVDKETDNSDSKRKVDTVEDGHNKRELKIDQVDKAASILTKLGKRRNGVVSITNDGKLGVPNFGFAFECERSKETEKNCLGDSSGLPQSKMSVTVSLSEPDVLSLMDREKGREFKIDESTEKPTTVAEENQGREGKGIVSVVNGNPSVSEDGHDMLGLPFSPTISLSKKRRPKSLKNWLRDPNLYKVCQLLHIVNHISRDKSPFLPSKFKLNSNIAFKT